MVIVQELTTQTDILIRWYDKKKKKKRTKKKRLEGEKYSIFGYNRKSQKKEKQTEYYRSLGCGSDNSVGDSGTQGTTEQAGIV